MNGLIRQILVYFYDVDGIPTGVADNFKGITWERCSSQVGTFRVTFDNPSATLMNIIRGSQFVIINKDSTRAGVITNIEESYTQNLHHVIVNGSELKSITNKRIILDGGEYADTKPSAIMLDILQKNGVAGTTTSTDRVIPMLSAAVNTGTYTEDEVDYKKQYQNVSETLCTIADAHDIYWTGTASIGNNGQISTLDITIYPEGTNRTLDQQVNDPIVLGFRYNTIDDIEVTTSTKSTKNFAYVGGDGEGAQRTIVTVGTDTGFNRNEIFTEGRNSTRDELTEKGNEALSKYSAIECSVITPSTYLMRKYFNGDFGVGDKVTIDTPRVNLIVTKVIEIYEKGYCYMKIELGRNKRTIAGVLDELTYNYNNLLDT